MIYYDEIQQLKKIFENIEFYADHKRKMALANSIKDFIENANSLLEDIYEGYVEEE